MLSLNKIVAGAKVRGLAGAVPVEVVRTEWIGSDALNVVYRGADGPAEVLLFRDAEPRLELVQASRAFSFDGDGETFRIASEAQRIRLAHLFDPYLAVHSSRIEPLPHQITAPDAMEYIGRMSEHPDRREVVAINAEDCDGANMMGWYFILRPEHGKPTLSPLHMSEATESAGQLMGLLR